MIKVQKHCYNEMAHSYDYESNNYLRLPRYGFNLEQYNESAYGDIFVGDYYLHANIITNESYQSLLDSIDAAGNNWDMWSYFQQIGGSESKYSTLDFLEGAKSEDGLISVNLGKLLTQVGASPIIPITSEGVGTFLVLTVYNTTNARTHYVFSLGNKDSDADVKINSVNLKPGDMVDISDTNLYITLPTEF